MRRYLDQRLSFLNIQHDEVKRFQRESLTCNILILIISVTHMVRFNHVFIGEESVSPLPSLKFLWDTLGTNPWEFLESS